MKEVEKSRRMREKKKERETRVRMYHLRERAVLIPEERRDAMQAAIAAALALPDE
jgi:hypothetical protein